MLHPSNGSSARCSPPTRRQTLTSSRGATSCSPPYPVVTTSASGTACPRAWRRSRAGSYAAKMPADAGRLGRGDTKDEPRRAPVLWHAGRRGFVSIGHEQPELEAARITDCDGFAHGDAKRNRVDDIPRQKLADCCADRTAASRTAARVQVGPAARTVERVPAIIKSRAELEMGEGHTERLVTAVTNDQPFGNGPMGQRPGHAVRDTDHRTFTGSSLEAPVPAAAVASSIDGAGPPNMAGVVGIQCAFRLKPRPCFLVDGKA